MSDEKIQYLRYFDDYNLTFLKKLNEIIQMLQIYHFLCYMIKHLLYDKTSYSISYSKYILHSFQELRIKNRHVNEDLSISFLLIVHIFECVC